MRTLDSRGTRASNRMRETRLHRETSKAAIRKRVLYVDFGRPPGANTVIRCDVVN